MSNRTKNILLISLISILLIAASSAYSITRFTSGIHVSDSRNNNATGTPVLMVDGKGAGVAFEVRDGATPVFQIPNGGGFSFPSGGNITLGGGLAADASLIYDGNAQDYHVSLDDSADDFVIGLGSAAGTTNALAIDENLDITLCDATASDCDVTWDGIAQDYYIGLDDNVDDFVIGLGSAVGTTPIIQMDENLDITLCDATASDCDLTYDGNAQDFYMALDDSADDLVIGLGGTVGTTPIIRFDEDLDVTLCDATASDCDITYDGVAQDYYIALDDGTDDFIIGLGAAVGTTPIIAMDENLDITLCDATADDCDITYDGITQDYYVALDDSEDDLVIGLGDTVGTTPIIRLDESLDVTLCDATADDCDITYDGITQDYYIALDDSEDDLVIGLGDTVGTTPIIQMDENLDITLCDATADDCDITWDGIAQDYYVALDDNVDDFIIGLGGTIGTTPIISMDENQDVVFAERVIINGVETADSATTNETLEIAFTSPADTTGANQHNAITCDIAIGNSTGGANTVACLNIDPITDDPQVNEKAINIGDEWDIGIDTTSPIIATAQTWFDDFMGSTVLAVYTEISGTDGQALQTIVEEQFGVYQLTSGDVGSGVAADAEGVYLSLNYRADQGSLVFETRLHFDTDVLTADMCAGFTDDVSTVEVQFTNAADTVTAVADDAVMFCYDTNATTDEWWINGAANGTEATGIAAAGVAPAGDVYQTLRIEIDDGGADCRFYIDTVLVGTLTANCVTNTDLLAPGVVVSSGGNAGSNIVDIDYIYASASRD